MTYATNAFISIHSSFNLFILQTQKYIFVKKILCYAAGYLAIQNRYLFCKSPFKTFIIALSIAVTVQLVSTHCCCCCVAVVIKSYASANWLLYTCKSLLFIVVDLFSITLFSLLLSKIVFYTHPLKYLWIILAVICTDKAYSTVLIQIQSIKNID